MKRIKLNFSIILGFATLFLFSGCYTQFSEMAEPGDQVYYEESQGSEDSGYYSTTNDDGYYDDEGYYSEAEPNPVIIEEYYYGTPFSIYYDPGYYDPYPYSGVNFRYVVSDPYWSYPPAYWYPRSYRFMAHYYPHFVDFDFYFGWGYYDPWYATVYFPPVVVYMPPYYPIGGWWGPCWPHPHYDPWDNGHHHNGGNGDPNEGRRDWDRRDPVIASGHSGTLSGGGYVQAGNSGNNGGRPPRENTITATQKTPASGSGINIEPVKTKENGRSVEVKRENKGVAVNSGNGQVRREPVKVSPKPRKEPVKLSPRTNLVQQTRRSEPAKAKTSSTVQSQQDSRPKSPYKSAGYQTGSGSSESYRTSQSKAPATKNNTPATSSSRKSYESPNSGSSSSKSSQAKSNRTSYRKPASSSSSSSSSYRSQSSSSNRKSTGSSYRSSSSSGSKSSSAVRSSSSSGSRSSSSAVRSSSSASRSSQSARPSSSSSKSSSRSSATSKSSKTRR